MRSQRRLTGTCSEFKTLVAQTDCSQFFDRSAPAYDQATELHAWGMATPDCVNAVHWSILEHAGTKQSEVVPPRLGVRRVCSADIRMSCGQHAPLVARVDRCAAAAVLNSTSGAVRVDSHRSSVTCDRNRECAQAAALRLKATLRNFDSARARCATLICNGGYQPSRSCGVTSDPRSLRETLAQRQKVRKRASYRCIALADHCLLPGTAGNAAPP